MGRRPSDKKVLKTTLLQGERCTIFKIQYQRTNRRRFQLHPVWFSCHGFTCKTNFFFYCGFALLMPELQPRFCFYREKRFYSHYIDADAKQNLLKEIKLKWWNDTGVNDPATGRNENCTGRNDKKTVRMKFRPVEMKIAPVEKTKKPCAWNFDR